MKVAIIHDELLRRGGAERVVMAIHRVFPHADIYTSVYNPNTTYEYFKSCNVKVSFLNKWVKNEKQLMLVFFPLVILAFRSFNLSRYDLVILSSAHGAQYIRKPRNTYVVNYAHYIFRLIWEPESYDFLARKRTNIVVKPIFFLLRKMDKLLSVKADYYLFNSKKTRKKYITTFEISKQYEVVYPPVDTSSHTISSMEKEYFLVVSRFEPYKKIDMVISAFQKMKNHKLIIVGSGTQEKELHKMASGNPNIGFEKGVKEERLKFLYANCKAMIFPQIEDFGLTPIECNSNGRPVIAFKKGGVLETMVEPISVVFFNEQSTASLIDAISRFENMHFDSEKIIENAKRFDEKVFAQKIQSLTQRI